MELVKEHKKSEIIQIFLERKLLELRGWKLVRKEEFKKYNGSKGCILFFIFPLLAFFGQSSYIRLVYSKD